MDPITVAVSNYLNYILLPCLNYNEHYFVGYHDDSIQIIRTTQKKFILYDKLNEFPNLKSDFETYLLNIAITYNPQITGIESNLYVDINNDYFGLIYKFIRQEGICYFGILTDDIIKEIELKLPINNSLFLTCKYYYNFKNDVYWISRFFADFRVPLHSPDFNDPTTIIFPRADRKLKQQYDFKLIYQQLYQSLQTEIPNIIPILNVNKTPELINFMVFEEYIHLNIDTFECLLSSDLDYTLAIEYYVEKLSMTDGAARNNLVIALITYLNGFNYNRQYFEYYQKLWRHPVDELLHSLTDFFDLDRDDFIAILDHPGNSNSDYIELITNIEFICDDEIKRLVWARYHHLLNDQQIEDVLRVLLSVKLAPLDLVVLISNHQSLRQKHLK